MNVLDKIISVLATGDDVREKLDSIEDTYLPHGSGFDSGCGILPASSPTNIMIIVPYRHMDGSGFYCGWSATVLSVYKDKNGVVQIDVSEDRDYFESIAEEYNHGHYEDCGDMDFDLCECDGDRSYPDRDNHTDYVVDTIAESLYQEV